MKKNLIFTIFLLAQLNLYPQKNGSLTWPQLTRETKPWTRWWWLGSAVDTASLRFRIEEMSKAGLGGVEITPIYGTKGFEPNFIDFLSPKWMEMLGFCIGQGKRHDLGIDMNTGTGWPFGGTSISVENAATTYQIQTYKLKAGEILSEPIEVLNEKKKNGAILSLLMAFSDNEKKIDLTSFVLNNKLNWTPPNGTWDIYAVFDCKTKQKVKRSAPGGEGWVMDHFSQNAVDTYLNGFSKAFSTSKCPAPNTFFNDSYEVYEADWTPGFFSQFFKRNNYHLEDYLPEFTRKGNKEIVARIVCDYRETMANLLLENFTQNWTNWAHEKGSLTRNQAHGSPGNLIDLYAAVDIPECESFGTTLLPIPGLRVDSGEIKISDSNPMVQKFASSAAHITGKKYISSETFTWLSEHFKTSLSQCKPELDQLFTSGVNHIYFHGTPYSPKNAPWPGWQFYASVNFTSYNTIWKDVNPFTRYIARCQSFLQDGEPANDVLLYWPVFDLWNDTSSQNYFSFQIHNLNKWLTNSSFYTTAQDLKRLGFDFDYISDFYLKKSQVVNGEIRTPGATYKTLIIPSCKYLPVETLKQILDLIKKGANVIFLKNLPQDVPGFGNLAANRKEFNELISSLPVKTFLSEAQYPLGKGMITAGNNIENLLLQSKISSENFSREGLRYIRRKHVEGFHYFIVNLSATEINKWIALGTETSSAIVFDPLTENCGLAKLQKTKEGTKVYLQLKPGQSIILKTFSNKQITGDIYPNFSQSNNIVNLNENWEFSFISGFPKNESKFKIGQLISWTELKNDSLKYFSGTGKYSIRFNLPITKADDWLLDLGKVCESARIKINNQEIGTVWSIPFELRIGKYLKTGKNTMEIEVTNLPANRISLYDQKKINWRIFYEINFVNVFYKPFDASTWKPMPSGLIGPVRLIPLLNLH